MTISCGIVSKNSRLKSRLKKELENFPNFFLDWLSGQKEDAENSIINHHTQVLFIDLDDTGVENPFLLVNQVQKYMDIPPIFIGISKNKIMAYEAIKNDFSDFLQFPLGEFDVRRCLIKLQIQVQKKGHTKICLRSNADYQFIDLNEILYLQADNNSTDFYLTCGKRITAFQTLKKFEKLLPKGFFRIHKSYIINGEKVQRINFGKSRVTLKKSDLDIDLPFSKKYKCNVNTFKKNLLLSHYSSMITL